MRRPLYHELAWVYELLVEPTGPDVDFAARAFEAVGAGPGARVIDAGCGTGRPARELAERGFRVVGVDRSPELIAEASRQGGEVEYVVADLTTWRPAEPADGVLCRGVLNDLLSDADRSATLRTLAALLRPGGALVVDVRDWERSVERYAEGRVLERSVTADDGTELELRSRTRVDTGRRLLVVDELIAAGAGEYPGEFPMRPWTAGELEAGLRDAGFAAVDLVPPEDAGARADRIVAVATR